jgi:hypothetical protein
LDYYKLFLRLAFSTPCVFEAGFPRFYHALNQIAEGIAIGKVYTRNREVAYSLSPRSEFETEDFRDTLHQVTSFIEALAHDVAYLERLLDLPRRSDPAWVRMARGVRKLIPGKSRANGLSNSPPTFHAIEFVLARMLNHDVHSEHIRLCIATMDKIDTRRNAIILLLNYLLEKAQAPNIPLITISSETIKVSTAMDRLGLPSAWFVYYCRFGQELAEMLDGAPTQEGAYSSEGGRAWKKGDRDLVARHFEVIREQMKARNWVSGEPKKTGVMWGREPFDFVTMEDLEELVSSLGPVDER